MGKKSSNIEVRVVVNPTTPALFDPLSGAASRSKEVIRLLQIGLKWEAFDSDPKLLLSYLAGVPVSVAPQVVPAKEVAVETKAALPRSQQSSLSAAEILIADFGGDLMAMFDGPPAEALAA